MKSKTILFLLLALLSISLITFTIIFATDYNRKEDLLKQIGNVDKKPSNSLFDIGTSNDKSQVNSKDAAVDTSKYNRDVTESHLKLDKSEKEVLSSLHVTSSEIDPDKIYANNEIFKILGKVLKVDDENKGVLVIEDNGSSTYINFEFSNLSTDRIEFIHQYLQVGRKISAQCIEEGRTFIVISFKIW